MQGLNHLFSGWYEELAETPELAKFNRHLDFLCWDLINRGGRIQKLHKECSKLVAEAQGVATERSVIVVTDYHQIYDDGDHPELKEKVRELAEEVRQHSKVLLLAHGVANMPDQPKAYARYFAKKQDLFSGGLYVPTREPADIYSQVPSSDRLCALKGEEEEEDVVTHAVVKLADWVYIRLRAAIDWLLNKHIDQEVLRQQCIDMRILRTTMTILTATYLPMFFAGTLGFLSLLKSDKMRIVVLGILALVLTMSSTLLVPKLKRSDLYAITAAYFAAGGVFIGAKSRES